MPPAAPGERWKAIPAFFMLPCELDPRARTRAPVVTWALVAAMVFSWLLAFDGDGREVERAGLVPEVLLRDGGLNLLTSFFVHGGIIHLLVNAYFLLAFGEGVEDRLGSARFALLVLAASIGGSLIHALLDPRPSIPVIGASGGISGVLAFYALAFPRARLAFLMPNGWLRLRWTCVSAATAFAVWILSHLLGAVVQLEGFSSVSSLAHLGGTAVGVIAWRGARF
jgi:membrane associated rhomboid family serine protease